MIKLKQTSKVQIIKNNVPSHRYLSSINLGLVEGEWIELIRWLPTHDYLIVQIHNKLYALPKIVVDHLEFNK